MNFLNTTLEPGMVPGPGLSATETFIYFVVAPIALFVVISALSYAGSYSASTKRNKRNSLVDHIE
ncbi:MAG: hypothetical protein ACKOFV_02650 [Candidatus Nanopelagicaceae bacterium]